MGRNRKATKQWKKFPMTLDDNYKSRLSPVTKRLRSLYKEMIEPDLDKLRGFEYVENKSADDSVEKKVGKKFHDFTVNYYGVSYPINGDHKTLAWRKLIENQVLSESKSVSNVHKRRYNRNVKFVLGVDPLKNEPWLNDVLKDWTAQNVSLIKGIPDFAIDKMQETVMQSVLRGDSTTFLKGELSKVLADSDKRLSLIARDQTNKLYGALTKFRSQSNGWDFYEWSDSNDSRVRPDHKRLDKASANGVYFRFSDPPLIVTSGSRFGTRGNPGDDIMCRCVAIISFLPDWRFKKRSGINQGGYTLIPISDLPPQKQNLIAG